MNRDKLLNAAYAELKRRNGLHSYNTMQNWLHSGVISQDLFDLFCDAWEAEKYGYHHAFEGLYNRYTQMYGIPEYVRFGVRHRI